MIRIGLISDTHGYYDPALNQFFDSCDEIWHAGDIGNLEVMRQLEQIKPVVGVYGNIDGREARLTYRATEIFERAGFKILMTHIGGYPGHYSKEIRTMLGEHHPDILVCGHSHILRVMKDVQYQNMWVLNPGAAGISGFHRIRTVLRFTLSDKRITEMEAIELGPRSKSDELPFIPGSGVH